MSPKTFAEILETIETLSIDAQEDLINILKNRIRDQKRLDLIADVKEAEQELQEGKCKPVTPEQLMEKIFE